MERMLLLELLRVHCIILAISNMVLLGYRIVRDQSILISKKILFLPILKLLGPCKILKELRGWSEVKLSSRLLTKKELTPILKMQGIRKQLNFMLRLDIQNIQLTDSMLAIPSTTQTIWTMAQENQLTSKSKKSTILATATSQEHSMVVHSNSMV